MSTITRKRIGPAMHAALHIISHNPGCTKLLPAEAVGPHGSRQYGYRTVDRCITAGLVTATLTPRGYQLTLTAAGTAAL